MFNDNNILEGKVRDILMAGAVRISTVKPSEWTEQRVIMGKPKPGPFSYDYTPYAREIVDCFAPDSPVRKIVVMKGSQVGISSGVLYPFMGWMIENNPGNTYLMVGRPDLQVMAVDKFDLLIHNSGLKDFLQPQVQRKRAQKSGDTNDKKDFVGGYVYFGNANNKKSIAQVDLQYILLDDADAMKGNDKEAGNLIKLLEKRMATYAGVYKFAIVSTPLLKSTSNTEPAYLDGDQRKYLIPCEVCHEHIEILWNENKPKEPGIRWEVDNHGRLKEEKVGYLCQKCGGFFKDNRKQDMLINGIWQPTAVPIEETYRSYHLSSLYAPPGMFDWKYYVKDYIQCNPPGQPRKEFEYMTFSNTVLGLPYDLPADEIKATMISKNKRPYAVGTIPELMSIADGNGRIVLVTCGADLNGRMTGDAGALYDDVRLDWEIVAHAESGATYSVAHGSVGTFIPREGENKADRQYWTAEYGKDWCIWPEFERIISAIYPNDNGGINDIFITGVDTGRYNTHVYGFLDRTECNVVGLRGEKEDRYIRRDANTKIFKVGNMRKDEYFLQVGFLKDFISEEMKLRWPPDPATMTGDVVPDQPPGFMNYPESEEGLYQVDNFFSHYESEHRITIEADNTSRWVKKNTGVQNHMWDCRVYNRALREIDVYNLGVQLKKAGKVAKDLAFTWGEYVFQIVSSL